MMNIFMLNSNIITKSLLENNDVLEKISILFLDKSSNINAKINWIIKKNIPWIHLYTLLLLLFNNVTIVVISITIKTNKYVYVDGK